MTISGKLDPPLTNEQISLTINAPNGRIDVAVRTTEGNYIYTLTLDFPGSWRIEASWPGNGEYSSCSSSAIIYVKVRVSLSLMVAPRVLGMNDTVILYIVSSPALADRNIGILCSYNSSEWQNVGNASTGEGGSAVFLKSFSGVGSYLFKASWGGDELAFASKSNAVNVTVLAKLTPADIIGAVEQINKLSQELAERERELEELRGLVASLDLQVHALQANLTLTQSQLSNAQSTIRDLQSLLSDVQSKLAMYPVIALVLGLIVVLTIGYVLAGVLRRRREGH